jgi:hypothetical protein
MGSPSDSLSRQTLEETPQRALAFLSGVGTNAAIRTLLSGRGYSEAEHQEGWELLHLAAGYETPLAVPREDRAAAEAIAAIDAWDEPNFRLARAALTRRFPEQAEFLFQDLNAACGPAALLSVRTFLDRLDMLEGKRPGRNHKHKATQKADQAAVATLEARGITPTERAGLRRLIAVAERGAKADPKSAEASAAAEAQATRRAQALLELRGWFDEWAEVARVIITRRDYLIRLGLARRKKSKKEDPTTPPPEPAPENG